MSPLLSRRMRGVAHWGLLAAAILVTSLAIPMTNDLIMNPTHGFIISLIVGAIIWVGVILCWIVWSNAFGSRNLDGNIPHD